MEQFEAAFEAPDLDDPFGLFGPTAETEPAEPDADPLAFLGVDAKKPSAAKPAGPAKPRAAKAKLTAPKPAAKSRAAQPTAEPAEPPGDSAAAARKIHIGSMKEVAKTKGMWAGALEPVQIPDFAGAVYAPPPAPNGDPADPLPEPRLTLVEIKRPHTPALCKILDEILVNALDHWQAWKALVTRIDVTFDPATGRVAVRNDGPGIPVVPHEAASAKEGRPIYAPEVLFSWFIAGTNIEKAADSVKGGTNGLGAKLTGVHSAWLTVETYDAAEQKRYVQTFRDRLDVIEPPTIEDLRSRRPRPAPYTEVAFEPAYAALGYRRGPAGPLDPADAADLDAWLRLRAHQSAAYVGRGATVTYNGRPCETTSAAALAALLLTPLGDEAGDAIVLSETAKAPAEPYSRHPWSVAAVVLPAGRRAGRRAAAQSMAIMNGVVSSKGPHVQRVKEQLRDAIEAKVRRATGRRRAPKPGEAVAKALRATKGAPPKPKPADEARMPLAEALAGVRLVIVGALPGADWSSQRKDELTVKREAVEGYALPAAYLDRVAGAVAERLLAEQGKATRVAYKKYTRAAHAGRAAHKAHTILMAAEGDSAITMLRAGLTGSRGRPVGPGGPSPDWCGYISLQGVIPNAAREVREVRAASGETITVRSAKLQANERLQALAGAMGLVYGRAYATPEELASLNYGVLALCVDQDLDGTGKIAALVLVWIHTFWPALLRAGRVARFVTPLVRVYPKAGGPPAEFLYEEELRAWLAANPGWARTHRPPKYYKGLAAHDEDEVRRMFAPEAFRAALHTYTVEDAEAVRRLFGVYFGAEPALRKAALVTPVAHLTVAEAAALRARREIPLGRVQLEIDTKAYKNDAIHRQIPGAPDGLNPARRKVIDGAVARFGGEAAAHDLKVFQLCGYVADKRLYHHGDASLNATIVYLAQAFPGARQYPYLIGVGQFGSRHGDEAGSPRYVGVRLSPLVRATFPPADRWHLPFVFEDGERAEPSYFLPVVPMAALETYRIVSEAWNHDSFGRDLGAVLAVVQAYVGGDPELTAAAELLRADGPAAAAPALRRLAARWPLPLSARGFSGDVRRYRGEDYSFGACAWFAAERRVAVTELPLGVPTARYLEALLKPGSDGGPNARAALIEDVRDCSSPESVELHIVLRPGAFEQIEADFGDEVADPLEDFLLLRASLRPHLNYYGADGGVAELGDSYLGAILYWAPLRRDLYAARLERERVVAELRLVEEAEVVRFIGIAGELDLARVGDDALAEAALRARGFRALDRGLLHRPEFTPSGELRAAVLGGAGANFDYLLDLRERDLVQAAVAKRLKAIAALEADLARVTGQLAERPVPGASVWRAEIEAWRGVVERGIASGWKFK